MENNVSFRKDLEVEYLYQLVRYGHEEAFASLYPSVEGYLVEQIENGKDAKMLDKISQIIAYRKNLLAKKR